MSNADRVRAELARAKDDVLHPWHADEPLPWESHPEETMTDPTPTRPAYTDELWKDDPADRVQTTPCAMPGCPCIVWPVTATDGLCHQHRMAEVAARG